MSMIDVSNLTFGYEGSPELIFDHVGFQIDSGWKLGFTGRNGRGKTTFLRLLQGEYPYSGTISASVEFEYFPYEVANLSRTGLEVVREIAPEAEDWEIQRELGLLDLAERSLELPFSSLSNGERTKVLLAAMFLKENAFLLIDEPTNHLDLEGRRKLGSYLARKRGFLLVSHDRAFLDQCVDHILAINRTNIEIQRGNFSSWWENRRRQDAFELARQEKLQILNYCHNTSCTLRTLPGICQLANGEVRIEQIREVDIEDLLGRETVKIDLDEVAAYITGKTVLVTGGGGSIGSAAETAHHFRYLRE